MSSRPPDSAQQLAELVAHPRESLEIEVKAWVSPSDADDASNIAQALLALANHGGGILLFGFRQQGGQFAEASPRPETLDAWNQDRINAILHRYAEPAFHCEVYHVAHPETGRLFPLIIVPGGQRVPVRSKSSGPRRTHAVENQYYVRRPGPSSEPPRTGAEWDALISRCIRNGRDELLVHLRDLISGVEHGAVHADQSTVLREWFERSARRFEQVRGAASEPVHERFRFGFWSVGYLTEDAHALPPSRASLLEILERCVGHESGWPPWWIPSRDEVAPYPVDDAIECWMAESRYDDGAHSDFWRATCDGKLFLARGYQDDGEDGARRSVAPGTTLDVMLPIWRTAESLLHAERLSSEVRAKKVRMLFQWDGLGGRELRAWVRPIDYRVSGIRSRAGSARCEIVTAADLITANLVDLTAEAVAPLFESFAFHRVPRSLIAHELARMRGRET